MIGRLVEEARRARRWWTLPVEARREARRDRTGLPGTDPGASRAISEGLAWLARAQDHSASRDGGVARHYSLVTGWAPSYPETTGYIVPTLLDHAARSGDVQSRERALRMLDWLCAIQFPEGGFQGGTIGAEPRVPVTFNTGQILLGLAAAVAHGHERYREPMRRAADWLVRTQDPDGAWRKHPTPFAKSGEKVYETHVAWGLLEAARMEPAAGYGEAALANIRWAMMAQHDNGWFERNCLDQPEAPLTHTIGYVLRGILEGWRFSGNPALLAAARRTLDALLPAIEADGRLPGRLTSDWRGAVSWVCLTGSAQVAHCYLLLFQETGDARHRAAAARLLAYVRRTIHLDGAAELRGGVKGSFPVDGAYGHFELLNWAAKFLIDACVLEEALKGTA